VAAFYVTLWGVSSGICRENAKTNLADNPMLGRGAVWSSRLANAARIGNLSP